TDIAATGISTLSLHDGSSDLSQPARGRDPRCAARSRVRARELRYGSLSARKERLPLNLARGVERRRFPYCEPTTPAPRAHRRERSEEHTSELQSQSNLVCRLL